MAKDLQTTVTVKGTKASKHLITGKEYVTTEKNAQHLIKTGHAEPIGESKGKK